MVNRGFSSLVPPWVVRETLIENTVLIFYYLRYTIHSNAFKRSLVTEGSIQCPNTALRIIEEGTIALLNAVVEPLPHKILDYPVAVPIRQSRLCEQSQHPNHHRKVAMGTIFSFRAGQVPYRQN